ncbi:carbonate dehydratase [Rhizobium sp. ARZ01]|uniref:carbonate dehydratase n=1 Tax=Rhizobium sp. ARZ01 TaxID=2769313 RepID=UPI00177E252A|nr:carbonate dehydratase [Rhizobium sp. ARZ01]MBD9374195.1 carbonate dehydratase [Rhizobium sp. ARZ01]
MLSDLFDHNRRWAAAKQTEDPDYFDKLSALQRPDYLWIGCSDSRVPANVITGLQPGEVFVHRNVANLVHRADLNLLSVLEFAVETLEVTHIIVCGHYGCGGVRAAMDGHRHGLIDHWLQPIRDVAQVHCAELSALAEPEDRLNRLCEMAVASQVESLSRTPILQSAWKRGRNLTVHGWIYGLKDGLLRDLNCDCDRSSTQFRCDGTEERCFDRSDGGFHARNTPAIVGAIRER